MNDELGDEVVVELLRTLERSGPAATDRRRAGLRATMLAEYDAELVRSAGASTNTESEPDADQRQPVLVEVDVDRATRRPGRRRRWGGAGVAAVAVGAAAAVLVLVVALRTAVPDTTTDQAPAQPGPADSRPMNEDRAPVAFELASLTVEMTVPAGMEVRSSQDDLVVVATDPSADSVETVTMVAVPTRALDDVVAALVETGDVAAARLQVATAGGPVDAWDLTLARSPEPADRCAAGDDCLDLYPGASPELSLGIGVNHRVALVQGPSDSSLLVMVRGARISEFSVLASELLATVAIS